MWAMYIGPARYGIVGGISQLMETCAQGLIRTGRVASENISKSILDSKEAGSGRRTATKPTHTNLILAARDAGGANCCLCHVQFAAPVCYPRRTIAFAPHGLLITL
jgi:hypothetical protein